MKKFTDSNVFSLLVILAITIGLAVAAQFAFVRITATPEKAFLGIEHIVDGQGNACVLRVMPNTPAEKSGIKRFDVIKKIDGRDVVAHEDVAEFIALKQPGESIAIEILRDGKILKVFAILAVRPLGK